ncbi:MAG: alpha-hydroxy acid oxidase, partial [Pseudomonadota bacterium]
GIRRRAMPSRPAKWTNIDDARAIARRRLPKPMWDLLEGGADDEVTMRRNPEAFDRYVLRPRALVDVSKIDMTTELLGRTVSMPVMLSPTGVSGVWHPEGEIAVARAAGEADVYYGLSTGSTKAMDAVAPAGTGPKMFQLYAFKDHDINRLIMERSRQLGYTSLCLTVDAAAGPGNRERDTRNGMDPGARLTVQSLLSIALHPRWALNTALYGGDRLATVESLMPPGKHSLQEVRRFLGEKMTASMTWSDVERIAKDWDGPFAVKGLMIAEDARRAVDAGATCVMVSNHGGRQLDGVHAAIDALPEIVDAVGGRAEILIDGGVRRGTHVLKALGLGATAVMIGRPYLYGLASAGDKGVARILDIFRTEIRRGMALLGARSIGEIDGSFVASR